MLGGGLKRDFQEECFLSLSGSDDLCCVFLLLKSPLGLALGPGNKAGRPGVHAPPLAKSEFSTVSHTSQGEGQIGLCWGAGTVWGVKS